MRGMQIAGITNINGNNLIGVSVSGLVGITETMRKASSFPVWQTSVGTIIVAPP